MNYYTAEAKFWFNVLDAALKIPGAKIDREAFLQKTYEQYCNQETVDKILQVGTHDAGIEVTLMERMANESIKQHTAIVTTSSFVAGIPGGLAMAATIPADVAQFYYHIIVEAQKLAYIFGLQSIDDEGDNFKEIVTVFIGVMGGISEAENALKDMATDQFSKKLTRTTIGKVLDKTIVHVAGIIGRQLTQKSVGGFIAKVIPLVGGIMSGGMTLFSYYPMCTKLKRKLYDIVEIKKIEEK
jgi:hypothetical protein